MPERPEQEGRRLELSGAHVTASALAAVSSALLLSELGAAGTVIGAAIASVVATVGSAVYVHVFRHTGDQLRDVRAQITPTRRPAADPANAADAPTVVGLTPVADRGPTVPVPQPSRTRTWLVRSAVGAVAVFALAMTAITVAELGMGRSFASMFGNGNSSSTVGGITGGGNGGGKSTPGPIDTGDSDNSTDKKEKKEEPQHPTPDTGKTTPTPTPSGGSTPPSTTSPDPTHTTPSGDPTDSESPTTNPPTGTADPTSGATGDATAQDQTGTDRRTPATGASR